jgi:hypothetical protein
MSAGTAEVYMAQLSPKTISLALASKRRREGSTETTPSDFTQPLPLKKEEGRWAMVIEAG